MQKWHDQINVGKCSIAATMIFSAMRIPHLRACGAQFASRLRTSSLD
jgi:hypothetical protein